MRLNKLVLTKISGLPKQVRRPMTFTGEVENTSTVLNELPESIHDDNLMPVSLDMDHRKLPIAVSNQCESVNLPVGEWEDERFIFTAEIDLSESNIFSKSVMTATIYGFTDTANVLNGIIDPFMQFYVNGVRISRGIELNEGYRSSFIENKIIARGNFASDSEMDMLLRPSDVLQYAAMLEEDFDRDDANIYVDTRSTFHTGVKLIDSTDLVPAAYFLRTLYAVRDELNNEEINGLLSGFEPCGLEASSGYVQETSLSHTSLGRAIATSGKCSDFNRDGIITYSELAASVTNGQEVTDLTVTTSIGQTPTFESNTDTCAECHIAYVLAQDLIYVATTYGLDFIKFTATNTTGEVVLVTQDEATTEVDKSELGESSSNTLAMHDATIRTRLHDTLVSVFNNRASNNNEQMVTLEVDADPRGLIVISISLDGCPVMSYCYAAFASGILSPVLTNKSELRDELAGLVKHIVDIVEQN